MKDSCAMAAAERQRLEARLVAIEKQIAAATTWGAHLTVLDEERRGIMWLLSTERKHATRT